MCSWCPFFTCWLTSIWFIVRETFINTVIALRTDTVCLDQLGLKIRKGILKCHLSTGLFLCVKWCNEIDDRYVVQS